MMHHFTFSKQSGIHRSFWGCAWTALALASSQVHADKPAPSAKPATEKSATGENPKTETWINLFDGKTLNGWIQRNGKATYQARDGMIVGTTAVGGPNSFLCTTQEYDDFILEFETKIDNDLNSGVQIRSKTHGNKPKGRVNGPQVEIAATGIKYGGMSGRIYGEAAGGWLSPIDRHKHFKDGEWNQYRVIAKGPHLKVWLNGILITDMVHKRIYKSHPRGFIALQVHNIPRGKGPYTVMWRKLRIQKLKP